MFYKRSKPSSSSSDTPVGKKRLQISNPEPMAKRTQLLSRTSSEYEPLRPQRTIEQTSSESHLPLELVYEKAFPTNNVLKKKELADKLLYDRPPSKYTPDLKIIKAGETQRKYAAAIIEYLRATKYEDIDRVNIRAINSTHFQSVFKHLIHRILPKRVSKPKFEDEVSDIVRVLGYPVPNSISSSSLRSYSTLSTNPALLALLYWLTECCRSQDIVNRSLEDEPEHSSKPSTVFSRYILDCYSPYMNGSDDFSVQDARLKYICDDILKEKQSVLEKTITSTDLMLKDMELFGHETEILQKEQSKNTELNRDVQKYNDYIKRLQEKNEIYSNTCDKVKEQIKLLHLRRDEVLNELKEISEYWASKNMTFESLDKAVQERYGLNDELTKVVEKYEEAERENNMLSSAISRIRDELEIKINEYNKESKDCLEDMIPLQYDKEEDDLNLDIINSVLPNLTETDTNLKTKMNRVIEESSVLRTKVNELDEKLKEEEIELKELKEVLGRKLKAVKSAREAQQKRQNEYNLQKDDLEQKRSRIQAESLDKIENTKSKLETKKFELIMVEKKIKEEENVSKEIVIDFVNEATRAMEDMKISGEERKERLLAKAEEAFRKFDKYKE